MVREELFRKKGDGLFLIAKLSEPFKLLAVVSMHKPPEYRLRIGCGFFTDFFF